MNYAEYITSIQQAVAANLDIGNIIFGIFLLIGIIIGLVFFFMYVRKEYYRKRSEIDTFLLEDQQKTDIFVPGLSDRPAKTNQKEKLIEKIYKKLNRDN